MTPWKYADTSRTVVYRTLADGSLESCLASREDVVAWVSAGNVIVAPDAPAPTSTMTQLAFLRRMTYEERTAARAKAKEDPIVEDFMDLFYRAQDIDLADPDTMRGIGYLELVGVLQAGRAAALLTP